MAHKLPARIYRCPVCDYTTEWRWVLKNHMYKVHGYLKRDAALTALESEYWLNPRYVRREDLEREAQDDEN